MKLHDLHVLMSVVQAGSMGKAASLLNTTQSAISVARQFQELRERKADLALGRLPSPVDTDIDVELLYHEQLVVVAGPRSKWLRRRNLALPDLANEPWLLPPPGTLLSSLVADGFRSHDMVFPPKGAATGPIHLLFALLASGPFVLAMSGSLLQLRTDLPPLKVLPIDFPSPPWPVGIMTLKNRTRSPVTKLFIECAREVVKPLAARHPSAGRARNVPIKNS